jgi:hypothetical protein
VSAAFDAHTCRLAYAWSGEFLDAAPAWGGRGGAPAKVLGARFWDAPAGCPVAATPSAQPPDFATRAKDPAYGGRVPEGKRHDGPVLLQFDGYGIDTEGVPTFRYHLRAGTQDRVEVGERVEALRAAVAAGLARRFRLGVPAGQTVWLLAGEASGEPRLLDAKGGPLPLDLKEGKAEVPASGRLLALPQGGDRVVVLALAVVPPGSHWRLQRAGGTWQALLRVPPLAEAGTLRVDLNVWAPYRNEPGLLKELFSSK